METLTGRNNSLNGTWITKRFKFSATSTLLLFRWPILLTTFRLSQNLFETRMWLRFFIEFLSWRLTNFLPGTVMITFMQLFPHGQLFLSHMHLVLLNLRFFTMINNSIMWESSKRKGKQLNFSTFNVADYFCSCETKWMKYKVLLDKYIK